MASANVACIDMGIIRDGPLCAYRWDGEQRINPEKFVCFTVPTYE